MNSLPAKVATVESTTEVSRSAGRVGKQTTLYSHICVCMLMDFIAGIPHINISGV